MNRVLCSLRPSVPHVQQLKKLANNQDNIKYGENFIQPRSRPRIFLARKFLQFVQGYEKLMQKHTPTVFEVYNSLGTGTKLLYKDIQEYLSVSKDLKSGKPVSNLTRKQLEVYYKVPKDMIQVAPTLFICAMPLTNYFIFPLLYAYPKELLSSQFWTERQWRYFELEKHIKRVQYYDSVLYQLEKGKTSEIDLKNKSLEIISKLRSGGHPTVEDIVDIKPLFQDGHHLALHNLSYGHLRALSLSQGLQFGGFVPYGRLWRYGGFIWETDRALVREGSLKTLTDLDIAQCCLMRGFNPFGCSRTEAEEFLDKWLTLSLQLKDRELSLLLHTPIFLAYNHRNSFGILFMPSADSTASSKGAAGRDVGSGSPKNGGRISSDVTPQQQLQEQEPPKGRSRQKKSRVVL
ncbi:LETM1 domain-containing protein 1-like [Tropilaelaps mercedesae]|uniref:LETM1 domain-containing protein 1-like n=1 Tax=Tropilaelaps mercedesae TaxID=418985 RepID=A0A1V9XCG1_9ACAR|nr:LETM1 domain-containing protein 1-like [Tropilaelaps mercedesae]